MERKHIAFRRASGPRARSKRAPLADIVGRKLALEAE